MRVEKTKLEWDADCNVCGKPMACGSKCIAATDSYWAVTVICLPCARHIGKASEVKR